MQRIGVLFVCLGNICRSPCAQGVLEQRLIQAGIAQRFRVDSCGTAAFNVGKPPDARAIVAAEKRGYDIARQRARQICDADYQLFRHIVAMDHANLRTVRGWAPEDFSGQISLLLHHSPHASQSEVADPFYADDGAFDATLRVIESGVDGLLAHLRSTHAV